LDIKYLVSISECDKIAMHRSISWADRSFMFYLFHHHVKGILCLRKFQGRKYSLLKSERLKIKQSKIQELDDGFAFRHLSYYLRTYNVLSKMHEARQRDTNFQKKLRPFEFHLWESMCNKKYYAVSTQIIFTIPLALKNEHAVHSPFVFSLLTKCFMTKNKTRICYLKVPTRTFSK
jgi:hypothetical protein